MATAFCKVPILGAQWLGHHALLLLSANLHSLFRSSDPLSPTDMFDPAATPAHLVFGNAMFVLGLCLGIFIVVGGLMALGCGPLSQPPQDDNIEPIQIYGSNQIELSWTVIPDPAGLHALSDHRASDSRHREHSQAGQRAGCGGDRAPVLVGIPLSFAGDRDRERAACAGERSGASDAGLT
jgi:hypothetical protein